MNRLSIISLIVTVTAITSQAQLKIAILNLDPGVGLDESLVYGLHEMLTTELQCSEIFTIKERGHTSDLWAELEKKRGSKFSETEIKTYGKRLAVDAILVGTVNYQIRERSLEEVTTGISHGEFNIDIRLVSVNSGKVLSSGGDVQRSDETTRSLMKRIGKQIIENYNPEYTSDSSNNQPFELLGYLTVYPTDLGVFTSNPISIIDKINRQAFFGYNNWRLPTEDELNLMLSNRFVIGLKGGITYASTLTDFSSGNKFGVRPVRKKVITQSELEETSKPYLVPNSKDFGTVPMLSREVSTSFNIVNPTSSNLTINRIKCTYSNITIGNYSSTIRPGESTTINIKVKTAGRQGMDIHREIKIYLSNGEILAFNISLKIS